MTFDEWRAANPDMQEVEGDCDECGGTGTHSCTCGDEHDCPDCDGTGKIINQTSIDGKIVELTIKEMYRIQLDKDKGSVEKFTAFLSSLEKDHEKEIT